MAASYSLYLSYNKGLLLMKEYTISEIILRVVTDVDCCNSKKDANI